MEIHVRRLEPGDRRDGFNSGDPDLDRFFHRFAGQNQFRHHIGTTYVAMDGYAIAGYATVSPSHLEAETVSAKQRRRLPDYPVPVLRLARLAVDAAYQGRGIGMELLAAVFQLARRMRDDLGCVGVVVDAKPGAIAFYERFGFVTLDVIEGQLGSRPEPVVMFLPMESIG